MKNKNLLIIGGVSLLLAMFSGCGDRSGEKEYNKAMASWENGDLVRAQGQLEKALRKLSGNEKKSVANNQLGLILWALDKPEQAIEKFGESCRLAEHLTGANENLGVALYHADELEQAELMDKLGAGIVLIEAPSTTSSPWSLTPVTSRVRGGVWASRKVLPQATLATLPRIAAPPSGESSIQSPASTSPS